MTHSKPRLISVGWSMTSSPGLTLMTIAWPVVLPAKPGAVSTVSATNSIMFFIGRSWDRPRRDVSVDELEHPVDRFDDDRRVERAPRVLVEIAPDHLAVRGPLRERDRRAVDADETFAVVMDEGQEVGLLAGVHLERAAGVEDDRVEVVQILRVVFELPLRERLGVRADHRVPQAGLFAEALDRDHRVRHGFVSVALFFSDHQQ